MLPGSWLWMNTCVRSVSSAGSASTLAPAQDGTPLLKHLVLVRQKALFNHSRSFILLFIKAHRVLFRWMWVGKRCILDSPKKKELRKLKIWDAEVNTVSCFLPFFLTPTKSYFGTRNCTFKQSKSQFFRSYCCGTLKQHRQWGLVGIWLCGCVEIRPETTPANLFVWATVLSPRQIEDTFTLYCWVYSMSFIKFIEG